MGTLVIGGTTASGKSSLAIELAQLYKAVIISADAMTVYRGLDVGTAKPSAKELESVPHLGIDIRNIDQECDVSSFCSLVDEAKKEHENLIIVGGTTFWLSALVRPLANLPASVPSIRNQLAELEDPHTALLEVDPDAAARLHPNDRVRIVRALEVHTLSGKTQTQLHAEGAEYQPIDAEIAWLDHSDLAERIHLRVLEMVKDGYVKEVSTVLGAGWSPNSKPLRSFSYKHMFDHLNGDVDIEEALRRTERDTRYFAKKQRTGPGHLGGRRFPVKRY
jgi:tRNA dimethylallyltransferase